MRQKLGDIQLHPYRFSSYGREPLKPRNVFSLFRFGKKRKGREFENAGIVRMREGGGRKERRGEESNQISLPTSPIPGQNDHHLPAASSVSLRKPLPTDPLLIHKPSTEKACNLSQLTVRQFQIHPFIPVRLQIIELCFQQKSLVCHRSPVSSVSYTALGQHLNLTQASRNRSQGTLKWPAIFQRHRQILRPKA